jgi:serine/threonine protein kinase
MEGPLEPATVKLNSFSEGKMLGRYEIVSLLGRGGMGEVYLARDRQLRRKVAVKVLPETVASDRERLNRFEQEAVAASTLNHPSIITIHEIGEADGAHFLVSEYVDGHTLRDKMRSITVSEALEIAIQTSSALKAAHEHGIVHRDIKPENIMIRADGLVKVLDFGLAKLTERGTLFDPEAATLAQVETQPGTVMGTVTYMSPEQARGLDVDGRTDIWSLGVVLYEMLSGRPPFSGATAVDTLASILEKEPQSLPSNAVSNGTAAIVTKALKKQAHDRYQTSDEMLADLRAMQRRREAGFADDITPNDRKTEILEPVATSRVRQWHNSSVLKFVAIGMLAMLVVGASVYYLSFRAPAIPQNIDSSQRSPAYDLYIRGKVKVQNVNADENQAAINLLEQAVATDPNYAEAWAALAKGYVFKSFNFAPGSEQKKLNEDVEVAVEKALDLNPNLPEGHLARGLVLWTHAKRFPHEQAIQALKRAIALKPDFDEAHQWLGAVYIHIGLFDEAAQEISKTLGINPSNTTVRLRMLAVNYYQGKYEETISLFKTTPPDEYPANLYRMTADSLVHLGRLKEADAIIDEYLKKYPNDEGGNVTSVKAVILAKTGKKKEAEAIIQQSIDIGQGFGHFHHTAYNIASAYALMKKPDEALRWLQNAADDGFPCYSYFEIDHHLDNIRTDPRFKAFMSKQKEQWLKYKAEYGQ